MTDPSPALMSEAFVTTPLPARYLGQLCKHFEHKLPVTLEERRGRIEFSSGVCELDVPDGAHALHMRVIAHAPAGLASLEDVVTRHLVRFAFRETLDVRWNKLG